jgi:hypothetical protein
MPFFFARGYTPVPQPEVEPEAEAVVREIDLVFRYTADGGGGQCTACKKSFLDKDQLVAQGFRDREGRNVYHAACFTEEAAA